MSSIKRLTTTLIVAGAVAAPAASALPASDPIGVQSDNATIVQAPARSSSGFDWGDAGIGAGGALAIALLTAGGVATLRHRGSMSPAS